MTSVCVQLNPEVTAVAATDADVSTQQKQIPPQPKSYWAMILLALICTLICICVLALPKPKAVEWPRTKPSQYDVRLRPAPSRDKDPDAERCINTASIENERPIVSYTQLLSKVDPNSVAFGVADANGIKSSSGVGGDHKALSHAPVRSEAWSGGTVSRAGAPLSRKAGLARSRGRNSHGRKFTAGVILPFLLFVVFIGGCGASGVQSNAVAKGRQPQGRDNPTTQPSGAVTVSSSEGSDGSDVDEFNDSAGIEGTDDDPIETSDSNFMSGLKYWADFVSNPEAVKSALEVVKPSYNAFRLIVIPCHDLLRARVGPNPNVWAQRLLVVTQFINDNEFNTTTLYSYYEAVHVVTTVMWTIGGVVLAIGTAICTCLTRGR